MGRRAAQVREWTRGCCSLTKPAVEELSLDQIQEMRSYEAIFGDLEGRRLVCIKRHLIKAFWRDYGGEQASWDDIAGVFSADKTHA